jgi:hypothetical protein
MTDDERITTGLKIVLIVILALFCLLKAMTDHPDWFPKGDASMTEIIP